MTTHHVVLLTYGEPPEADFRTQFAYSTRILLGLTRRVAPIPLFAVPFIALSRARLRVATWRAESYRSPIEDWTRKQAERLADALRAAAPERAWSVQVAYEFRAPLLERTLAALPPGDPVTVVPMYVADSEFTHAIAREKVQPFASQGRDVRVAPALDPDALAEITAAHVERELARRGFAPGPDTALVLAAHGTLITPPRPMETGRIATTRVAEGIALRLAPRFGKVVWAWLNHVLGGEWTSPPVDQALRDLAAAGIRRVVYLPYGFLADNAESQLEGRIALRAQPGFAETLHLPCLNDTGELATLLAGGIAAGEASANAQPRSAIGL